MLTAIDNIKKKREELNNLLNDLKTSNNTLKDHWETKTSDSVFANFEEFYKEFQNQINVFDEDIRFLEATVNNYKTNEKETNKEIDENIAI